MVSGLWNQMRGEQFAGPTTTYARESKVNVTDERALQISTVYRCIRLIAETAGSLPMKGYAGNPLDSSVDRVELPSSHWLPQLIEYPNEIMTGAEWREAMYAQMAGWGNGYSSIVPNDAGRAVELWPYTPAKMRVDRLQDQTLQYTYPNWQGSPQVKPAGRVFHLRAFGVDGAMGLSPLALARESMGLAVGAERYAGSFFGTGGRPSGIMTSEKLLTDPQREQIRKEYGSIADGTDEKRLWVLEANLKYQAVTVSPEDMQMLQTRSFQTADIANFFGVPLFLLNQTEKVTSWGTGLEQQNLGFLAYTLRPYLRRMIDTWNMFMIPLPERGKVFVDIDVEAMLELDSAAKQALFASYTTNGIATRNEVRRRLKWPRSTEKNADALTVQVALTPIEKLGETPPASEPIDASAREAAAATKEHALELESSIEDIRRQRAGDVAAVSHLERSRLTDAQNMKTLSAELDHLRQLYAAERAKNNAATRKRRLIIQERDEHGRAKVLQEEIV